MAEHDNTQQHAQEQLTKGVLDDVFRFGAAIGSWHNSKDAWHQRACRRMIEIVYEEAYDELQWRIRQDKQQRARTHLALPRQE